MKFAVSVVVPSRRPTYLTKIGRIYSSCTVEAMVDSSRERSTNILHSTFNVPRVLSHRGNLSHAGFVTSLVFFGVFEVVVSPSPGLIPVTTRR